MFSGRVSEPWVGLFGNCLRIYSATSPNKASSSYMNKTKL